MLYVATFQWSTNQWWLVGHSVVGLWLGLLHD
jgi:hypothetical protein